MSLCALLIATISVLAIGGRPVQPRGRTLRALTPGLVVPNASVADILDATFKPKDAPVTRTAKLPVTPNTSLGDANATFEPKTIEIAPNASTVAAAAKFNPESSGSIDIANLSSAPNVTNDDANRTFDAEHSANNASAPEPAVSTNGTNLTVTQNASVVPFVPKPLATTNLTAEINPNVSVNNANVSGMKNFSGHATSAARSALRAQQYLEDVQRGLEVTLNGTRISVASGKMIADAADNITKLHSGTPCQGISMLVVVMTTLAFTVMR